MTIRESMQENVDPKLVEDLYGISTNLIQAEEELADVEEALRSTHSFKIKLEAEARQRENGVEPENECTDVLSSDGGLEEGAENGGRGGD